MPLNSQDFSIITDRKAVVTLTQKQNRALIALLTQPTREEAAKEAGITSKTLRGYLEDTEFQAAYKTALAELLEDATTQAKQSLNPALTALREIAEDGAQQAQARVSAARSLLEYSLKLTEQTDILEQLQEIEEWREEVESKH